MRPKRTMSVRCWRSFFIYYRCSTYAPRGGRSMVQQGLGGQQSPSPYNPLVLVSDFDDQLPPELIAQEPLPDRAASRLLRLDRRSGTFEDRMFREFPALLRSGDLVVFNDTKVFPARLFGRRAGVRAQPVSPRNPAAHDFLKGRVEVLLTRRLSRAGEEVWEALVHPGRKIVVGERLFLGEHAELEAEVIARGAFGERTLRFFPVPDLIAAVERIGHVPLPPYIARPDRSADRDRYQTVYASKRGSVAAPTAGLHFTPEILAQMRERGIETAAVTLHVGLGTFQPVHVERVEEHRMHSECYSISQEAAAQINAALKRGRRVVAVGTTTVRTLEHAALAAAEGGRRGEESREAEGRPCEGARPHRLQEGNAPPQIAAGRGEADVFIYPGFQFKVVGALLTNFHLPRSTLLMLVCAFAGREHVLAAYAHAVEQRYRFYSYGDCMWVE